MLGRQRRIASDDDGQDLAEYGISLAVIGVVAVAASLAIGTQVGLIWDPAQSVVDDVAQGHQGHHGDGNNGNGNGNNGNGNGPP